MRVPDHRHYGRQGWANETTTNPPLRDLPTTDQVLLSWQQAKIVAYGPESNFFDKDKVVK